MMKKLLILLALLATLSPVEAQEKAAPSNNRCAPFQQVHQGLLQNDFFIHSQGLSGVFLTRVYVKETKGDEHVKNHFAIFQIKVIDEDKNIIPPDQSIACIRVQGINWGIIGNNV